MACWALGGFAFGLCFVAAGWLVGYQTLDGASISAIHTGMPLMWIIDLAPLVLAIAAAAIGGLYRRVHEAWEQSQKLASELASNWTVDLQRTNAELAAALDRRERISAMVSHEMRTPLTAIVGHAELLKEPGTSPENARESVDEIASSATFMLDMVNDLLDTAKLADHGMAVTVDDIDGDEIAREVSELLKPLADSKHLALSVELCTSPRCRADPARLRQVVTNLVANAIKFTDSGSVVMHTHRDGDHYVIDVTDEGPGIVATDLNRVFSPFEQVHDRADRDSTGLGLTISRCLTEAMGGTLTVTSTGAGYGSTFTIQLPTESGAAPEERTALLAAIS